MGNNPEWPAGTP